MKHALQLVTARRSLSVEPLNVAPQLIGQTLATPIRRALAMLVDLSLIGLLSEVGGFFLVCGLALVVLLLRGPLAGKRKRVVIGWAFVALLAVLAAVDAWDEWGPNHQVRRAERTAEVAAEVAAEAESDAVEPASTLSVDAAMRAASQPSLAAAVRIAQLEAEVAELRKPAGFQWRKEMRRLFDAVGISFGWGIVYFSLLPAWWNGQTLGKKWLGLRIVELTGRPLTVMRCLRRYGGYAAGMATGGLGFMQLLWDPNRQGIQDRVAHTAVIDLRPPPAPPQYA